MRYALDIGLTNALCSFARSARRLLPTIVTLALLLTSVHHALCGSNLQSSSPVSITIAIDKSAVPAPEDQCVPGHCHCVCHVTSSRRVDLASKPVEFYPPHYGIGKEHLLNDLGGHPPFKPPRA
jgi:hypothetical protein